MHLFELPHPSPLNPGPGFGAVPMVLKVTPNPAVTHIVKDRGNKGRNRILVCLHFFICPHELSVCPVCPCEFQFALIVSGTTPGAEKHGVLYKLFNQLPQ